MKLKTMLYGLAALLSFGACFAATAQNADTQTSRQLLERLSPSIWGVMPHDTQGRAMPGGSAVVIGSGRLVTSCHILARAKSVSVGRENIAYGATLEHPDAERDLCILKVANFTAPAVTMAGVTPLKEGTRVYAISNLRGLETTIGDGLLSGVRRSPQDELVALQTTIPFSRNSSGAGLFDAQGQLLGITTSAMRESQSLTFALPATWITEVPERAQIALARVKASPRTTVYEYRLRDRTTGTARPVIYRLDRIEEDRLIFNQGTRIEKAGGAVVSMSTPIGGEFDMAMPPGGWVAATPQSGARWDTRYEVLSQSRRIGMDLTAQALNESTMRIGGRELRVVRVQFTGYTERGNVTSNPAGPYEASAWYAPELGRVVRFEATARGGRGGSAFFIEETLELVDIREE